MDSLLVCDIDCTLLYAFTKDNVDTNTLDSLIRLCGSNSSYHYLAQFSAVIQLRQGCVKFLLEQYKLHALALWSASGSEYVQECRNILNQEMRKALGGDDIKEFFLFAWDYDRLQKSWEWNGKFDYSKPISYVSREYRQFGFHQIVLLDDRKDNGQAYPDNFCISSVFCGQDNDVFFNSGDASRNVAVRFFELQQNYNSIMMMIDQDESISDTSTCGDEKEEEDDWKIIPEFGHVAIPSPIVLKLHNKRMLNHVVEVVHQKRIKTFYHPPNRRLCMI